MAWFCGRTGHELMIATRMMQAAASGFSPSDISGMVFDHDCDLIAGNDGDAIASHTFQVEFSESDAGKRPILKKGANGINGHNVLRFSGGQAWRTTSAVDLSGTQAATIFIVANITGAAATRILYEFSPDTNTNVGSFNANLGAANTVNLAIRGNIGFSVFTSPASITGAVKIISHIGNFALTSGESSGWINGIGGPGSSTANTGNMGNYVFFVGARNEGSLYVTADIARIILYNRALAIPEREQVEGYLSSRYGLGLLGRAQASWFADNAYTDTEIGTDGDEFIVTSDAARLVFSTAATSMTVVSYNDIYGTYPTFTKIGVIRNGTVLTNIAPGAAGAVNSTVALAGGAQTIELINGLQSKPSDLIGTYVRRVEFNAAATRVTQPTTPRIVAYGDSIAVGANATNPPTAGVWQLVRDAYNGSLVIEGWGYRSLYDDCNTSELRAAFVAHLAGLSPDIIWLAIGTNDYGLNKWSAASFGTAYAALLDDLNTALPSATIYCQTPIERTTETANGSGSTLGDYRTQITTASNARSGYCVTVDGTAAGYPQAPGDLDDGVHPTTAGHALYGAAVILELGL